jgi:hypothetical protein
MAGPLTLYQTGVHGSRPAASSGCVLYSCTTHSLIYKSDGSAWTTFLTIPTGASVATDVIWDTAGDIAVATGADTAAKLAKGIAGAELGQSNGAVAWTGGTSFPGSPATGDRYYRTDLHLEYYYDGTRWLTTTLFREPFGVVGGFIPQTADGTLGYLGIWNSTDIWMETLYSGTFVLTTNDGSKYWTVTLQKNNAAGSPSTIVSFTTAADTASTWTPKATSIGALLTPGTYKSLQVSGAKTTTPGNLYWNFSLTYRVVGT